MGLGVPSSWLGRMILPTGGGIGAPHSQQNRDWAFLQSAFPPPLAAGDWARPYGLRIPSLLAGGALAEMNRRACSTPFFVFVPPVCKQACTGRVQTQKNRKIFIFRFISAEREGFEPPDPLRSTVFKTAAIDHSATSPSPPRLLWDCKGRNYFCISKFIFKKIDFFCEITLEPVGKRKNQPLSTS